MIVSISFIFLYSFYFSRQKGYGKIRGSNNAGPGSNILWPELILSEGKETLLEKKKANDSKLGYNFLLLEIFISEGTLYLS